MIQLIQDIITDNACVAFFSAIIGAIIPVIVSPFFKDIYERRKEVSYIKQSLKQYVSYMDYSFKVSFMFGSSSNGTNEYYSLSVPFAELEGAVSNRRFNKGIMLSINDYKNILHYCYKHRVSRFGLDNHEKIYTDLFLKRKYKFV